MLNGYKTYLAGLSAFLTAVALAINDYLATGTINYNPIIMALIALAMIFLRQGVKPKKGEINGI